MRRVQIAVVLKRTPPSWEAVIVAWDQGDLHCFSFLLLLLPQFINRRDEDRDLELAVSISAEIGDSGDYIFCPEDSRVFQLFSKLETRRLPLSACLPRISHDLFVLFQYSARFLSDGIALRSIVAHKARCSSSWVDEATWGETGES